jgi:uncharacterized repeat protein (TIGR03803 family)
VLHSFKGGSEDGESPQAGLIDINGTLDGTTSAGGGQHHGTPFAMTTSGKETVLHDFGGSEDGRFPAEDLIKVKGTLYGTTSGGGQNYGGTVFSLTP